MVEANGRYLLRTPENERAASQAAPAPAYEPPREPRAAEPENVYALYEANIGLLTPMVADQLRDAEQTYPVEWIEAAIREATERNVRNWRYVATILNRWAAAGRGENNEKGRRKSGEPGRHPETLTAAEYVQRFGVPVPRARG